MNIVIEASRMYIAVPTFSCYNFAEQELSKNAPRP
jgi:hypothetical protein